MRRRTIDRIMAERAVNPSAQALADAEYARLFQSEPPHTEIMQGLAKIVEEGRRAEAKRRRHVAQMNAPIAKVTHRAQIYDAKDVTLTIDGHEYDWSGINWEHEIGMVRREASAATFEISGTCTAKVSEKDGVTTIEAGDVPTP